jgi:hypothetical protein
MYRTLVAFALAGSATLLAVPASAAPSPQCGDTLTASAKLTSDLTCVGTALTVSIPAAGGHITVNLNGHTITGNGFGTGIETLDASSDPASSIEVVGGSITGFVSGLISNNANSAGPHNLTVRRVKVSNTMQWSARGVSGQYLIQDSTFTNAGFGGVRSSGHLIITNSKFVNSQLNSASSSTSKVYTSTFTGAGMYFGSQSNITAVGNTLTDCTYAIDLGDPVAASVQGNQITRCKVGIRLDQPFGPVTVEGNQVTSSTEDGMQIATEMGSDPITIAGNTFSKSVRHGLSGTAGSSTTIVANTAEKNGALGISVTGATDGGGNIGRKNTDTRQCVGVVCSS